MWKKSGSKKMCPCIVTFTENASQIAEINQKVNERNFYRKA